MAVGEWTRKGDDYLGRGRRIPGAKRQKSWELELEPGWTLLFPFYPMVKPKL